MSTRECRTSQRLANPLLTKVTLLNTMVDANDGTGWDAALRGAAKAAAERSKREARRRIIARCAETRGKCELDAYALPHESFYTSSSERVTQTDVVEVGEWQRSKRALITASTVMHPRRISKRRPSCNTCASLEPPMYPMDQLPSCPITLVHVRNL